MELNHQNDDEIVIDVGEVLTYLVGKIGYMVLAGILLAVITLAVNVFLITPKYVSTTKMYVLNRQTNEAVTNSDIQSSTYLTKDYMELIKSRIVIEGVIAEQELDTTYEKMLGVLTVSVASDTRVISISVRDTDPYRARDVANNIRVAAAEHIQRVMNTEAVNVVDEANVPTTKESPKIKRNVLLAGGIGFLLTAVIFVIIFITNDKITTQEDVERYLGLSILGVMPLDEEEVRQKKARKRQDKKNKRTKRKR